MSTIKSVAFLAGYSKEASTLQATGMAPTTATTPSTPSGTNPEGSSWFDQGYDYLADKGNKAIQGVKDYGKRKLGDVAHTALDSVISEQGKADQPGSISSKFSQAFQPVTDKVQKGLTTMAAANAAGQVGVGLMRNMSDNRRHQEMMKALGKLNQGNTPQRPAQAFRLSGGQRG